MVRREALNWLFEARVDLTRAERALSLSDFALAAFMSQQACEKALRALYMATKREYAPRTHDLTVLYRELRDVLVLPDDIVDRLPEVSQYYVTARYPNAGRNSGGEGALRASGLDKLRGRIPEDVVVAIEQFLKNLIEHVGPDVEVYLFGSYARGDWLYSSDIDLVVVSDFFRYIPWHRRYPLLRRLAPDTHAFEILAYSREEFERLLRESLFLKEISKYWVKIYP